MLSPFSPNTTLEKNFAHRMYGTLSSLHSRSTISACRLSCLLGNLADSWPGMVTPRLTSKTKALTKAYASILDNLDDDQDLTFAMIQQACGTEPWELGVL